MAYMLLLLLLLLDCNFQCAAMVLLTKKAFEICHECAKRVVYIN